MTAEDAIEVSNLTKHYDNLLAVDHISFEVRKGEIFGFLGPNGAGKTTTIRMLTGIIKPDDGAASILGHDILREGLKSRQVTGVVPEMANAYIDLSAWGNLTLMGELYGVPRRQREKSASALLRKVRLYDRRNSLVRGFSRGMKQRLLLCMALVSEPQILFLDEPTSGLDVESQWLIKDMIREINKSGTTVFLTTHNMEEANQLCDRIAIINHGKIAAIDTPEKLRMQSSGLNSVEVSFEKAIQAEELMKIEGAREVKKTGDKIRLYTDQPSIVLERIVDFARSRRLKIVTLNTLGPTLEDVFLRLVKES
ncbi:MAG: ATP-binding cassette domain-containing protein [Promethearchaeati archaeon SRVP18_Atabeyarchaeia-1]